MAAKTSWHSCGTKLYVTVTLCTGLLQILSHSYCELRSAEKKTRFGKRGFLYSAPAASNNLPLSDLSLRVVTDTNPSGVLSCWPDGLELTPAFYPGTNEQHRLF